MVVVPGDRAAHKSFCSFSSFLFFLLIHSCTFYHIIYIQKIQTKNITNIHTHLQASFALLFSDFLPFPCFSCNITPLPPFALREMLLYRTVDNGIVRYFVVRSEFSAPVLCPHYPFLGQHQYIDSLSFAFSHYFKAASSFRCVFFPPLYPPFHLAHFFFPSVHSRKSFLVSTFRHFSFRRAHPFSFQSKRKKKEPFH